MTQWFTPRRWWLVAAVVLWTVVLVYDLVEFLGPHAPLVERLQAPHMLIGMVAMTMTVGVMFGKRTLSVEAAFRAGYEIGCKDCTNDASRSPARVIRLPSQNRQGSATRDRGRWNDRAW